MKCAFIVYTAAAYETAQRISASPIISAESIVYTFYRLNKENPFRDTKSLIGDIFSCVDAIIFVSAAGIAVRCVAPFIKSKTTDPAVLAVSEDGKFVIPLLSGHIGGANALAEKLAFSLDATAVITTATDINSRFAVDVYAAENNLAIGDMTAAKLVSAAILAGEEVGFCSDTGAALPSEDLTPAKSGRLGVCVSYNENNRPFDTTLTLVPKNITLGIGCRKGVCPEVMLDFIKGTLKAHAVSEKAVCRIASIDLKRGEKAIAEAAACFNCGVVFYTAEELMAAEGDFKPSPFVLSKTGTDNVCERAAALASGGGSIIIKKQACGGVTVAAAKGMA